MNLDWHILGAAMGSWILTYLLHATVLLSGAALAAIALRARPELEEAIWKLALVGGLLTASLQPAVAGWKSAQPTVGEQLAVAGATPQLPDSRVAGYSATPQSGQTVGALTANGTWRRWLLGGWTAGTLLLLARLLTASLSLRRRLAGRREISGPLARLVDRLLEATGRRRSVRLTRTEDIPVPIALGGEICMPERALRELPPGEQETVVAHEMAHVLRRDPAWLLAGRVLGALFFFHPLVLLAGRRLRRVAELRCDDWAAAATGRPLALARCLTRVAGWGGEVMPATAMAGDPRWLAGRVTRLLDRDRQGSANSAPRWLRPVAAVALVAVVLWMPGISLAADTATESEPAAESEPTAEAPQPVEDARPVVAPLPPDPAPAPVAPVVAPVAAPVPVLAPVVAPQPVVAPLPPVHPAPVVAAAAPLPPAELAALEAVVAVGRADFEGDLADLEREVRVALDEVRWQEVEVDVERELDRAEVERQGRLSVEEQRELAEQIAAERERMAEEVGRVRQQIAEELAAQRSAMAEEARRMAEQAAGTALEMESQREQQRELARQLAEEIEQARQRALQEVERLAPELEKLRHELQLRTEEREQLRRELEILRRELESQRQKDDQPADAG